MSVYFIVIPILSVFCTSLVAQEIDSLLDKIYATAQQQEAALNHMGDYSYLQSVHFIKRDGDGEIEEQSTREFRIYVRPPDFQKRMLISAHNYEDGKWLDVTDAEKDKDRRTESQEFSLSEIVAPENRFEYSFVLTDTIGENEEALWLLNVNAIHKNKDRFNGDLLFRQDDCILTKAELRPSDTPTGIESMRMIFDMHAVGNYWLPLKIYLEAHISFLFFFKGSIQTTIDYSDFRLGRDTSDSLFFSDP